MPHRRDAQEMPQFLEPMLARLATMPADQSQWAFEIKWDGVRAIARCRPPNLHLLARNGKDISAAYPELQGLAAALAPHEAMLDGEIVAFDRRGRPSFQALQTRMHLRDPEDVAKQSAANPIAYIAFDLLWLDGEPLLDLPYEQRRERLATLELQSDRWRTPAHHVADGDALLAATREQGLEGVIAKRLGSRYAPGRRESSWRKIKHSQRQELVIGGWTTGKGSRSHSFGALELGAYDEQGKLRYAGRVGTGFSEAELDRLTDLLAPLAQQRSPFTGRQPAAGAHFVRPELICEVQFSEWTQDGSLRAPSYLGLRDDKPPRNVRRESSSAAEIQIEGRTLKLTNLEKVLYPASGFTKGEMIDWHIAIAPALLPHLRDRPLTLKRYPDGVQGKHFYEKQSPRHRPEWVQTTTILAEREQREIEYTLCQDLPTLVWLANLAAIELHPSLSLAGAMTCPTSLVFDLDPGPPAGMQACCEVALELAELFDQLGLQSLPKTSGSKGLQVYVPLNSPEAGYEQTKSFAHAVANLLSRRHPDRITAAMGKAQRTGRVLIDWSQNDRHKTTVSVYSLRARERPTVSTPVSWDEIRACFEAGQDGTLSFEHSEVLRRLAEDGDLFAADLQLTQRLPDLD
jgi:bifunctional non-homologous end joining protein LigD